MPILCEIIGFRNIHNCNHFICECFGNEDLRVIFDYNDDSMQISNQSFRELQYEKYINAVDIDKDIYFNFKTDSIVLTGSAVISHIEYDDNNVPNKIVLNDNWCIGMHGGWLKELVFKPYIVDDSSIPILKT